MHHKGKPLRAHSQKQHGSSRLQTLKLVARLNSTEAGAFDHFGSTADVDVLNAPNSVPLMTSESSCLAAALCTDSARFSARCSRHVSSSGSATDGGVPSFVRASATMLTCL